MAWIFQSFLRSCELPDDLLRGVTGSLYDDVPGPIWADDESYSQWKDFRGQSHL